MSRIRRPRPAPVRPPRPRTAAYEAERQALMAELLDRYARLREAYEKQDLSDFQPTEEADAAPVGHSVPGATPATDGWLDFQ